ncbi:UBX domain-containing protein/UIM domain-containing protein [Cephalotus follicularis]|uniref:UBX domain-containing protein/UIM domain-containing protein n=1 Tax=Cephalotus follicularis TaxID=3775 RepID=A0A1Q3CZB8_CEPFO|nr:UBX domain-containing protein/UIM domain-containing protein [Cephalotus follicularis]
MARPTREEIDTFMSITGASESLALRKLEEYGGNLADAVNGHYLELERHVTNPTLAAVTPQYNSVHKNNESRSRGVLPLLSAARSFKPSLLFDPSYRRNLYNQIGASAFTSRARYYSHTGEFGSGNMQPHQSGPMPVFEDAIGTSSHGPSFQENVLNDGEVHQYGNDIEEEMFQAAIEASKKDFEEDSSGIHHHLEDDEIARVIALSLKMAEQEKEMHKHAVEGQDRQLGVHYAIGRAENTNNSKLKLKPGSSSLKEGAEDVVGQPSVLHESNEEFGGISRNELNEAVMLEAAFFGEPPEGSSYRFAHESHFPSSADKSVAHNPHPVPRSPPPSLTAQRLLREQQNVEYLTSLLADREKEIKSLKEVETLCRKEEVPLKEMHQEEELEKWLAAKEASLPQEPTIGDENAVTLLVRMPDGSRHGRRFLKSDKLQFLFDFIDVSRTVKPGTYRVVRPYPRRAFNVSQSLSSLDELDLTSKHEALFLELI